MVSHGDCHIKNNLCTKLWQFINNTNRLQRETKILTGNYMYFSHDERCNQIL